MHDVGPNSTATPKLLVATRSSKKVSLLDSESGLTPARNPPLTRYKPARACFAACLTEAAKGTEEVLITELPSHPKPSQGCSRTF